ncbi:hypothetical protein AAGQ96_08440 [Pantoea sp. MBD-2R]|uniref:hypothetical protein n=1 Tax=Pantoea sp. MBD-2R TaxID=3141540 RepID=UPI003183776D
MTDPVITDVFKFVAVRPADLITDAQTDLHFIHDTRLNTSFGERTLNGLARKLATPAQALAFYQAGDIKALQPLSDRRDEMLAAYRARPAEEPLPPQEGDTDAPPTTDDKPDKDIEEQSANAFDLLYAAWMSGPDAGKRLPIAMDALRLLHYLRLRQQDKLPDVASARAALQASPLIPPGLSAFTPASETTNHHAAEERKLAAEQQASAEQARLRPLFEEYATTQRLLSLTEGDSGSRLPVRQTSSEVTNGSQRLMLSNQVRFGEVMGLQTPVQARSLMKQLTLNDSSSLPQAHTVLKNHLQKLNRQLALLPASASLKTLVQEYQLTEIGKLIPADSPVIFAGQAESAADVDMSGKLTPLGIGDLLVVKQQLIAYQPGEVAHIENVLKGEFRERTHRMLDRTETILFSSTEDNQSVERDTQSTDRFELKKEAEKTVKEEMSVSAGVTVTGGYGPVKITAQGDFAYKTASEESTKNSSTFAHEVIDRSISKIEKKIKTERTDKTFHEVEETNKHGIDNKDGDQHIIGVYRWVDKQYHAQIYNYGRRLMLEFILPEPAAYYRASQRKQAVEVAGLTPPVPFLDLNGHELTAEDITENNYQIFASRYNATVEPPPPAWTYVGTSIDQSGIQDGATVSKSVKDLVIADGYQLQMFTVTAAVTWHNYPQFILQFGEWGWHVLNNTHTYHASHIERGMNPLDYMTLSGEALAPTGIVPLSVAGYDVNAYAVNVAANCIRTPEKYQKWQSTSFAAIYTAWQALKTAYDQKITQAQAAADAVIIEGRNPAANLEIEKCELKKLCITMMTGQHFNQFDAMTSPEDQPKDLPEMKPLEALKEGRYIQFFEQAFDWPQLTWLYYPYFWGRKKNWVGVSNLTDSDALFASFLQAGAARVIVPVPLEYSAAVLFFLQKNSQPGIPLESKLWLGGEPPTLDDPEYKSIVNEIRKRTDDLYGAQAVEPKAQNGWDFTLPTTLVWLQSDAALPAFPLTI